MAVMGEQLLCEQKPRLDVVDRFAKAAKKDSCITVGLSYSENCSIYQGSEIANSHSYRQPMIFFRSSQTKPQTKRTDAQLTVLT